MATQRSQCNPLAIEARGRVLAVKRGCDVVMNKGILSVDPGLSYLSIPGYPICRSRVILSTVGNKPEAPGLFQKRKSSAAFARIMTGRLRSYLRTRIHRCLHPVTTKANSRKGSERTYRVYMHKIGMGKGLSMGRPWKASLDLRELHLVPSLVLVLLEAEKFLRGRLLRRYHGTKLVLGRSCLGALYGGGGLNRGRRRGDTQLRLCLLSPCGRGNRGQARDAKGNRCDRLPPKNRNSAWLALGSVSGNF
ncbi:hypothetical protein C8F04DRAFT_1241267 [Mycena alexandri]|uniref:Uncharacterized protein n=1 Tax=Mycena alexandri TaxID=1745969 RepID=A0AAD6S5G0_9AGAR|nr:hypothetical protein C8F04DRAFT_1241267 [Mycena alexandri]